MFKVSRWRSEKSKIKVGFKLQFDATQVPQIGWETMVVSLVPMDVGKPTATSEKAQVIDGECHWMKPVKETVKLVKDQKTGKTHEKIYRFLVSATRSGKCGFLGEMSINLADYEEVLKPAIVCGALKAPKSGVILHVTIQRMQADLEGREGDDIRDIVARKQGNVTSELLNCDKEECDRVITTNGYTQEESDNSIMKSYEQFKYPPGKIESQRDKSNGILRNSSSIDYTSASGSDSSSGQYTPEKNGTNHTKSHEDSITLLSPHKIKSIPQKEIKGLIDVVEWSVDLPSNGNEDVVLARQVEVFKLELQALRKQVAMERRRGEDLSVALSDLKEERDALQIECEELKRSQSIIGNENVSKLSQLNGEDLHCLVEEIKQELNHEKNSNSYLRLQLQKTQESNAELILAVQDLDELLEQKNREMHFRGEESGNAFSYSQSSEYKQELFETISEDGEQRALEELVKGHDGVQVEFSLEQKIVDLYSEIDGYKKDHEDLEMQMEQLALDYEILKQENHAISAKLEQTQLREQLRMQYECSTHLTIITDLEARVMNLENELEEQADSFETDVEAITRARVEQEQRAIRAEEELRNTRWSTAKTAEKLKEDFERLSIQISSTFHMNEDLASQAQAEAAELRLEKCHMEELLEKANTELSSMQDQYQIRLQELLNLINFKTEEADKLLMDLKEKSEEIENKKRDEESRQKAFSQDMMVVEGEMERLSRERAQLSKEIEHKEVLLVEMEQLKESTREEAKKSLMELLELKQLKNEKEALISSLNSEVATLRAEYNDLNLSLVENDVEKEKLRKQIFNLRGELKKKEDTITSIEKKFKDSSIRNKNNKPSPAPHASKEVTSLREKVKILEEKIKMKDDALEDTKNSFQMKEKEMSNRIEELEKSTIQSEPGLREGTVHQMQEIKKDEMDYNKANANGNILLPLDMKDEAGINGELNLSSRNGEEGLIPSNYDHVNLGEVLDEMDILKDKNQFMESELKEMQERYSEISLKFAEVEGERQQLVMTVRNLMNALRT